MKRVIVFFLLLLIPSWVRAEFFIAAYGGMAHTQSGYAAEHYSAYRQLTGQTIFKNAYGDLSGSESVTGGLRFGYWFKREPRVGIALDSFGFNAEAEDSDLEVSGSAGSFLLMFRYPIHIDYDLLDEWVCPYVGIGPTFFGADVKSSVDGSYDHELEQSSSFGMNFSLGVFWLCTKNIGLFLEYRYVSLEAEEYNDWQSGLLDPVNQSASSSVDMKMNLLVGGISYHF